MMNQRTHSRTIPLLAAAALLASAQAALAQDLPPEAPNSIKTDLPMQTTLLEAERMALVPGADIDSVRTELAGRAITVREDGMVHCEVVGPENDEAITQDDLRMVNGEVTNRWRNRADVYIPITQLSAAAQQLPPGHFLECAAVNHYDSIIAVGGEGAIAINSDSYRDGGANGAGRVIAVIDGGYQSLTTARNAGDAPPLSRSTLINYTGGSFEGGTRHGTGCVEAVYDHAPGATYRIYKIDSLTDMGTAVTDALANGADVFTHSLSRYNLGWNDNSGAACTAANQAANGNALFFTSAGNRAQQHWQGTFNGDGDNWHNYSGGDETINITVQNGGSASYYLAWNTAGGADYDLYLYDSNLTTVLASSTNGGTTFESFGWTNTGSTRTVHLAVLRRGGPSVAIELFAHDGGGTGNFQYAVAAGSTTSPSNATNSRVISIGAVDVDDHDSPNGTTGIIMNYSSQGPSNNGMLLPDLAGPTNTTTTSYGGTFGGTSAATPNTAGAAAAFWSADSSLDEFTIWWLMREQADLWKDWGANGPDNIYGYGGAILYEFAPRTKWLSRNYGNVTNNPAFPFYTFAAAYNAMTSNGRILIFAGGSYPETFITGTKSALVETVQFDAVLGD
ncbi:MAG: S8 family serine peptidase [Phycisphaerales bacterium]